MLLLLTQFLKSKRLRNLFVSIYSVESCLQMFANLQATFNTIVKDQKLVDKRLWEQQEVNARFLKQGAEIGAIVNQLRMSEYCKKNFYRRKFSVQSTFFWK